jgi:hypothetical protein
VIASLEAQLNNAPDLERILDKSIFDHGDLPEFNVDDNDLELGALSDHALLDHPGFSFAINSDTGSAQTRGNGLDDSDVQVDDYVTTQLISLGRHEQLPNDEISEDL